MQAVIDMPEHCHAEAPSPWPPIFFMLQVNYLL